MLAPKPTSILHPARKPKSQEPYRSHILQAGVAYGVLLQTNSRLCEVYSQGPEEGAASYVCTLQGTKEEGTEMAFAHRYQTEVGFLAAWYL